MTFPQICFTSCRAHGTSKITFAKMIRIFAKMLKSMEQVLFTVSPGRSSEITIQLLGGCTKLLKRFVIDIAVNFMKYMIALFLL